MGKMISEIVLINPDSPALLDPKVMPPLGLLYISSILKENGVNVKLIDLAGNPNQPIPESKHYGITATTSQYPAVKQLRKKLSGDFVIGGPHATLCPHQCLEDGFDAVVVGDGEKAILNFAHGTRGLICNPVEDLGKVPFPDRSIIKDYNYEINGKKAATIITAKGCIYRKCAFCSQTSNQIRYRPVEDVGEELIQLKELGYEAIMIFDDEFFSHIDRDVKICFYLAMLELDWRCFSRSNFITKEVAYIAKKTRCKEILLGIESGSDQILLNINKGITVKQHLKAIEFLHKNGIRVKAAMIIMLPGESKETLKETWKFCEKIEDKVAEWDWTICTPYPGSDIYNHPERYDLQFDPKTIFTEYKGGNSPNWKPPKVATSQLTFEEGKKMREKFEQRFKFHRREIKFD
jgi:anaerobic magnesium-protoporphyrin IX monomethyl ester cyclase